MAHGAALIGALVLGFGGGCLGALLVGGVGGGGADSSGDGDGAASSAELARLSARVDALAASVRTSRVGGGAPRAGDPGTVPPKPTGGEGDPEGTVPEGAAPEGSTNERASAEPTESAAPSEETLRKIEARVAALERSGRGGTVIPEDLSKLTPAESEALLRSLLAEKRNDDLLRVADELVKRGNLTADQRTETDLHAGYALRGLGKHAEAEARFRETLARVGETSEKGAGVIFQIAWERTYQRDVSGAANEMERVANHPGASSILRVHGLYNAGRLAKQAGDTARARDLLERLIRDHAADIPESQPFLRTESERMLRELGAR